MGESNAIAHVPQIGIAELAPCTRHVLRVRPGARSQALAFGRLDLEIPLNTCAVEADRIAARLGPDEWMLFDLDGAGRGALQVLENALAGTPFSLVDIGHRHQSFTITGARARDVLNGGCPLDLSDAAFPPHSATRTLFGKAEIILLRTGAEHAYRVECWRSFAPYVRGLLEDVAREFTPV
jgi:sarcosine oxidase, subunit gamma